MGLQCSNGDALAKLIDENDVSTLETIKKVSVISSLKKSELIKLALNLLNKDFKKGEFIMKYGEDGTEFYIIISGTCGVFSEDGVQVAKLAAGDYVGEMALLDKAKRNATIECLEDCETLVVNKEIFDSILGNRSKVRFEKRTAKRMAVLTVVKDFEDDVTGVHEHVEKSEKQINWLLSSISSNILFSNLGREEKLDVIGMMYKETIEKDTILIKQGDLEAQTFHVIDNGTFAIHIDGEYMHDYKAGMCFGELALLHDSPRTATVTATEDSVIWTMHRDVFRRHIRAAKQEAYQQRIKLLLQVKQFRSLTRRQLGTMSEAFEVKTYEKDKVIINEGDIGDRFFVIKSGEVKWKTSSGEAGIRKAGEYFGERALINNQKRAATITASTTTVCLELHKTNFEELLGTLVDEMKKQMEKEDMKTGEWSRKSEKIVAVPKRGSSLLVTICELSQLETVGILGKGAFGVVSLVIDPITKKSYALKAMKKCQIAEMGFQDHIVNEKDVMLKLYNDFLVNLRGTFKDKLRVYLLLDVCLGGELFTVLRTYKYFSDKTSRFYAACVVEAFGYMHSLNIIYRDLKPENLVLDSKGFLKVTDFGFAKQIEDQTFTLCGTPEYFAPEIVTGQGHGKGVDWWTLGILIYEMLASFSPFYDDEPMGIYKKILAGRLKFPKHFSLRGKEIIKAFLKRKATGRLGVVHNGSVDKIKRMDWFRGFSWADLKTFKMKPPIKRKVKSLSDISNFKTLRAEKEDAVPISPEEEFDATF